MKATKILQLSQPKRQIIRNFPTCSLHRQDAVLYWLKNNFIFWKIIFVKKFRGHWHPDYMH